MDEKQWFEPNCTSRNHFAFIMIVSMVATEENIITPKISQLDTFLISNLRLRMFQTLASLSRAHNHPFQIPTKHPHIAVSTRQSRSLLECSKAACAWAPTKENSMAPCRTHGTFTSFLSGFDAKVGRRQPQAASRSMVSMGGTWWY